MTTTGSSLDLFAEILTEVIAGRRPAAELIQVCSSSPTAGAFLEDTLRTSLVRQDWDAIDVLVPVCAAHPLERCAGPLADILDRESLEISNQAVVTALAAIGSPTALPALRRAMNRTSTPHAHWVPGADGESQLGRIELRIAIGSLLRRFPNLGLAVPAEEVEWRSTMLIRGPWALPVLW